MVIPPIGSVRAPPIVQRTTMKVEAERKAEMTPASGREARPLSRTRGHRPGVGRRTAFDRRRLAVLAVHYGLFIALGLWLIALSLASPNFLTWLNFLNVFRQIGVGDRTSAALWARDHGVA